jgi:hypothetical protein
MLVATCMLVYIYLVPVLIVVVLHITYIVLALFNTSNLL